MSEPITAPSSSRIFRAALWVAIGALIAAALVCVVWVLIGDANGLVGRAFLTILLLAAFAGVAILEANLSARRPAWFALASMATWVVALIVGAFLIWMPVSSTMYGVGFERFLRFLLIVLILQGALLHVRLFSRAYARYQTTFTSVVAYVTMALVVILAVMLIIPVLLDEFARFTSMYWRVVVALAILAAVGTALIPLVNALFAPKIPRAPRPVAPVYQDQYPVAAGQGYPYPAAGEQPAGQLPWPTYADGRTPLPVLPDGSPDWNAYYTGWPTYPQQAPTAVDEQTGPSARTEAPPVPPAPEGAPAQPAAAAAEAPAQPGTAPEAPAPSAAAPEHDEPHVPPIPPAPPLPPRD